ncbi:uncharacterized protein LOC124162252 isoform X2 [Ischnura elegans]|uniref:uncharacterized protein LOC124162252 isoform X2 n=1 Tax=Ischnura elegans TaxID=197161 RepID=UPI001ED88B5F|nr:uncharacterized protein LOC124162252 isoform X2 [Ischnura elegans]
MGLRSCCVPGCSTGYSSSKRKNKRLGVKNGSLFKAKSESQLEKWRKAIPRKDKVLAITDRVCERHFSPDDIIRSYETRLPDGTIHKIERGIPLLKNEAVPSIFPNLPKYLSKESRTRKPPTERKLGQEGIGGQNLEEEPNTSVDVRHAEDLNLVPLWDKAIGRTDRRFVKTDVVCELHFKEDDIDKYWEVKGLPGGEVHRIEKKVFTLKKHAVPSIFPPPDVYNSSRKKKGCRTEDPFASPDPQECAISDMEGDSAEDSEASMVEPEIFDFQVLMKEALNIVLPSDMWTVGVLKGNQVIFANWSDGETVEAKKRVLIDEKLQVKIYFGSVNGILNNMKEVRSLAEVGAFLIVIDQLNICQSSRSPKCLGYTIPKDFAKKETSAEQCRNCQKAEKDSPTLDNEEEIVGRVGLQNKILRKPKSSQLSGHLHKKKRKVLRKKGVHPEGKHSPEGAIKKGVCDESCAVDNSDVESGEEAEIEDWAPPPEWRSLATPLRLLSPPPEDFVRPAFSPSETVDKRMGEGSSSLDIEALVRDVHRISLPSNSWTLGVLRKKRLVFACWKVGKVLEAEKRLVVNENLSVKVIFGNMILALDEIRNVTKFEDIGRYLYIIDKMSICNGIGTGRRAASCPGYFIPGQVRGNGFCLLRCAYCQGASEELMRIRRMKKGRGHVRAEAQGKVWKNLKMLSDLYPEMKKGAKILTP